MSNKMCCYCIVISLITLILVCVLVYQNFKPQVDGFDNHSTQPVINNQVAIQETRPSRNNIIKNQLANTFYSMCLTRVQDSNECCSYLTDDIRSHISQCNM